MSVKWTSRERSLRYFSNPGHESIKQCRNLDHRNPSFRDQHRDLVIKKLTKLGFKELNGDNNREDNLHYVHFFRNTKHSLMEKIVFTNGCFDIIHAGHIDLLRRARELGSKLVVGINSDASVRAIKGAPRPFVSQNERAEVLARNTICR